MNKTILAIAPAVLLLVSALASTPITNAQAQVFPFSAVLPPGTYVVTAGL